VGSTGVVDGQPARLARVYHAASGRECREVLVGGGMNQRALVACRDADGSFVSSRPLLLGGRP
jgi:predicted TIM-barrel enzyme